MNNIGPKSVDMIGLIFTAKGETWIVNRWSNGPFYRCSIVGQNLYSDFHYRAIMDIVYK